jgi:hypothetical protein
MTRDLYSTKMNSISLRCTYVDHKKTMQQLRRRYVEAMLYTYHIIVVRRTYVVGLCSYYTTHTFDTLQQRSTYVVLILFFRQDTQRLTRIRENL